MHRSAALKQFARNLAYACQLVNGIPDSMMAQSPAGVAGMNHPAWILGHLAVSCDFLRRLLGQEREISEQWSEMFGWSSEPRTDVAYPDRATLMSVLREAHEDVAQALMDASEDLLDAPSPLEEAAAELPLVADLVLYLMTSHEGIHLGQLSAWRRASGLPRV